jgi:hypothetical protein
MREVVKSIISLCWILPLFGVKQVGNILAPKDAGQSKDKGTTAFEAVTHAIEAQLESVTQRVFKAGDELQRGIVDMLCNAFLMGQPTASDPSTPASAMQQEQQLLTRSSAASSAPLRVDSGRLKTDTFIVLGEGLAAGMGDFTLSEETQKQSFPAYMAQHMQAKFTQPLLRAPGLGHPVGFAQLPVRVPAYMQTTVREQLCPIPFSNLAVPGYTLADALHLRPTQPLVHRNDAKQTLSNLILGMPSFVYGKEEPWPTQLEWAVEQSPTFTLVELGYYEVLEAAVKGVPDLLPEIDTFQSTYAQLLTSLKKSGCEVLVMNIPDPMDTAHFSTVSMAAKITKVEPALLLKTYDLQPHDLITVKGLVEIGSQFLAGAITPLPEDAILSAEVARQVSGSVRALNAALASAAQEHGALVYNLQAFFHKVKNEGITVGSKILTAEFLGGFYSLNGYYPGQTGHALIANEVLDLLNKAYGASFGLVDVGTVLLTDPVATYQQAEGPDWTSSQLPQPRMAMELPRSMPVKTAARQHEYAEHPRSARETSALAVRVPLAPLQLPPSLEQVLPLSKAASYFGDAIVAIHCRDEKEAKWGSCENLLFGGLALLDSHLSGDVGLKFTPLVNNVTHFEVTIGGGLVGDDGILAAPQFYKLPARQNRVQDVPSLVSSGDLNVETGEVSNLKFSFNFSNTALLALTRVNPQFPQVPINFPGQYGSAWAQFAQRPDGKLDFTFYGSTFLPLGPNLGGDPLRFPLPFASPTLRFASIPCSGTALHPHIHLSTKELEAPAYADTCPDIPCNTIQEFTLYTHNSSFGDAFHLDIPQLGGSATGRSHVMGRVQIQFGEPSGGSVPIAVSYLNSGGVLASPPDSPIAELFPGRLPPGPQGFNEFLRFPLRTYSLNDLSIIDDPFDISVGAVNLQTGRLLNALLHRGFINQDLFFALIRVEPRTPKDSFFFRGPAWFDKGRDGQPIFRFKGEVFVPYPGGFKFPKPDLATDFTVNRNSRLDPFLWIRAIHDGEAAQFVKEGGANDVLASTGDRFSYSYIIPGDPARHKASFAYENHTQQGAFRLHSLAWVGFSNSLDSQSKPGAYDTITFTGFGIWSKDGVHSLQQASVQISTSPTTPYVGIQIDSGNVSSVNTKPANAEDALP